MLALAFKIQFNSYKQMNKFLRHTMAGLLVTQLLSCNSSADNADHTLDHEQPEWVKLFNGKDLNDWKIKIAKYELEDNFANTFRIEDSLLTVSYDGYDSFDQKYGHIFYDKPYSHYLLRVEYRFIGEQAPDGEGWAWRNSGAMLHCQSPESMLKDQDYPISLEAQFLGGKTGEERSTGNLCTPGTEVFIDGKLYEDHCLNSSSETYAGDQWVRADLLVLGDSIIKHIIEGDTVMTYTNPRIGGDVVNNYDPKVKEDGKALTSGYISLQSESHPIQYRKVDIIDLAPYAKSPKKLEQILVTLRKE